MSELRSLRKQEGLTIAEAAEALGITIIELLAYEKGERDLSIEMAAKFGELYSIDLGVYYRKKSKRRYED